jgi:hypothetical protein
VEDFLYTSSQPAAEWPTHGCTCWQPPAAPYWPSTRRGLFLAFPYLAASGQTLCPHSDYFVLREQCLGRQRRTTGPATFAARCGLLPPSQHSTSEGPGWPGWGWQPRLTAPAVLKRWRTSYTPLHNLQQSGRHMAAPVGSPQLPHTGPQQGEDFFLLFLTWQPVARHFDLTVTISSFVNSVWAARDGRRGRRLLLASQRP